MQHIHFDVESDGLYGAYWKCKNGSALFVKQAFSAAKKYPKECKAARIDIDRRMTRVICDWRDAK